MNRVEKDIELTKEVVSSLTKVLETGDWESSLFLQTRAKRLRKLIDEGEEMLRTLKKEFTASGNTVLAAKRDSNYILVYVSLYQADEQNLDKWHSTIKSLVDQSNSRPIYRYEHDILAMIRSKSDKKRSGFVAVYVNQADILKGGIQRDPRGHELLRVKERAITLDNIVEFSQDDKKYRYWEGKLILEN